ncbi:MAG: DUF1667 domain-containing protein [Methanomassiliicoccales archaeon]|nr:DUF1667 domain-containing protein [Methanomassiliicoccales archaeon]
MRLVCIACPLGCELLVREDSGRVLVQGNRCTRGEAYAREEMTDPKRVLATSVKVLGGDYPLVSVRTDRPVPKRLIPEIMAFIRTLRVEAPVELGQIIVEDLLGSGAKLLATRTVRRAD